MCSEHSIYLKRHVFRLQFANRFCQDWARPVSVLEMNQFKVYFCSLNFIMYSDGEEGSPVEDNAESESEDVVFLGRTPWVAYMERNLQDLNIDSLPYEDSSDCSLSTGSEDESGLEEDVEAEQQEIAALRKPKWEEVVSGVQIGQNRGGLTDGPDKANIRGAASAWQDREKQSERSAKQPPAPPTRRIGNLFSHNSSQVMPSGYT